MFFGGLNGDGFADESDYDYGSYAEGPYRNYRTFIPKPPNTNMVCSHCGFEGLRWSKTTNGWRLAYTSGPLAGKLHACDI